MCFTLRSFVKLKKIKKSEKNSKVGGWVKPQLESFFFFWNVVFLCVFCCLFLLYIFPIFFLKNGYGGGWMRSGQSEFFSDFWIFFNLTKPLKDSQESIHTVTLYIEGDITIVYFL